jgi:TetR/AcrR family transcriptional repressor of nem operon
MRVSQEEKERSHERIVESASKMLRAQGAERPSVADFMNAAGMTHGGFYRHFASREELLEAALAAAFDQYNSALEARIESTGPRAATATFMTDYLSDGHAAHPEVGCPLAAVGGDIARGSDELKTVFGAGLERAAAALSKGMDGPDAERRDEALRAFAMMAGAVMLARASPPETAKAILAACRKG